VDNLRDLQAQSTRPKHKAFKAWEPGYLHVDVKYLPQMADETSRRYLFVAIDRATRWVFIRDYKSKTAANARRLRDQQGLEPSGQPTRPGGLGIGSDAWLPDLWQVATRTGLVEPARS